MRYTELYEGIFPMRDSYANRSAGADNAKYKMPFAMGSRLACWLREKSRDARAWAQTLWDLLSASIRIGTLSTHHIGGSMFPNRDNAPTNTRFSSCDFDEIMPCDGLILFEYSCNFQDCCCSYINPLCLFQGCFARDDGMETTGGMGGICGLLY